jgi:hypothetical protein
MLREFERLAGRLDRRALDTKRALLREAVMLARLEVRQDRHGRG